MFQQSHTIREFFCCYPSPFGRGYEAVPSAFATMLKISLGFECAWDASAGLAIDSGCRPDVDHNVPFCIYRHPSVGAPSCQISQFQFRSVLDCFVKHSNTTSVRLRRLFENRSEGRSEFQPQTELLQPLSKLWNAICTAANSMRTFATLNSRPPSNQE